MSREAARSRPGESSRVCPAETLVSPRTPTGRARPSPHCRSQERPTHGWARMGPLLNTLARGAGESGEAAVPADLLCVWEWQVGPGEAAAVSEGLAPGGQRAGSISASSGTNFLFGRENSKAPAGNGPLPTAFFLPPLARHPWREAPHGWVSPAPSSALRAQEGN